MNKERKWPRALQACLDCQAPRNTTRYSSRGLCTRCYEKARRAGELEKWTCSKATIRSHDNPTLQACMLVGSQQVSADMDIPLETLVKWARAGTPQYMFSEMREYAAERLELEYAKDTGKTRKGALFSDKVPQKRSSWRTVKETTYPEW